MFERIANYLKELGGLKALGRLSLIAVLTFGFCWFMMYGSNRAFGGGHNAWAIIRGAAACVVIVVVGILVLAREVLK